MCVAQQWNKANKRFNRVQQNVWQQLHLVAQTIHCFNRNHNTFLKSYQLITAHSFLQRKIWQYTVVHHIRRYSIHKGVEWCLCLASKYITASCDLHHWPLDPLSWKFHAPAMWTTCSFVFIILCSEVWYKWMNKQTGSELNVSLVWWRHNNNKTVPAEQYKRTEMKMQLTFTD